MSPDHGSARWRFRAGPLAVALVLTACSTDRRLEGAEIDALFRDHTVEGYHERHGYFFRSYYDPDGKFRSYQDNAPQPRHGRWWVRGEDICIRWIEEHYPLCRKLVERGQRYLKLETDGDLVIITFTRFTPGNPHRL